MASAADLSIGRTIPRTKASRCDDCALRCRSCAACRQRRTDPVATRRGVCFPANLRALRTQLVRRIQAPTRFAVDSSICALTTLVTIALLPALSEAQSVGPTPQPEGVPITSEQTEQVTPETWAIHGQTTFTPMFQPAFRSPYQGPLSLQPDANGRETTDVTLYLGFRPWQGAEIWINPEMDQGFGLSNTVGVAGFVSGEAYKVGEADPYYQMPRGFFRQTIDLGGEAVKLDPDLNQLGGTTTANRLVFTIGKFSVVDIFDNNKYAHDPRNDFLNWSIVDMGSFD
ncbi:MAG TPA: carbohydrate porin, partial [Rhodopila sp.]